MISRLMCLFNSISFKYSRTEVNGTICQIVAVHINPPELPLSQYIKRDNNLSLQRTMGERTEIIPNTVYRKTRTRETRNGNETCSIGTASREIPCGMLFIAESAGDLLRLFTTTQRTGLGRYKA